jgi:hypothetical protein
MAVVAVTVAVILSVQSSPTRTFFERTVGHASTGAWLRSQAACGSQGMRIALEHAGDAQLLFSAPSSSELALSWPSRPAGITPSLDNSRPAYICAYSGHFARALPCPSFDQLCGLRDHSSVLLLWLLPHGGPLLSFRQSVPSVPIPVAG